LCLFFLFLPFLAQASDDAVRFRIFLKDKAGTEAPQLSALSLMRREKQGLTLDSTDFPVSTKYKKVLLEKGFSILSQSRWMNTVVVSAPSPLSLDAVLALPFVAKVQTVWSKDLYQPTDATKPIQSKVKESPNSSTVYGKADMQVRMLGLPALHEAGFKGRGKLIAVVDAGFFGADTMSWFKDVSILATKDFTGQSSSIFKGHAHGTSVLSVMAAKKDYIFVGTAPEATYCLLRSEDPQTEFPIEEDYWIAAVEYADSIGVDIVSSSVGYSEFDIKEMSYSKAQLDGKTAYISKAARIAAAKGMLMVCSAGNLGSEAWAKIMFPADVATVLTVGSVQPSMARSFFSSKGPTADKRIKPDVVALGSGVYSVNAFGQLYSGNGTSFSAPLISGMAACIWQAMPQLTALELLQLIRSIGSKAFTPDFECGYGVPDAKKIVNPNK